MLKKSIGIYTIIIFAILTIHTGAWAGTATLSWDPNTESDLAGYKAYYGTISGSYTQSIDVGNVTTYTINGLTEGLTYFFVVTAYDTAGNESNYSNEVSKTILDTTPPVLSVISASNITSSGATITWTTNEASTSQVDYGTTTAYGSSSPLDSTLLTSHSRTLSSLSPSTTYHYRVRSTDSAGNVAISGDNTFTTASPPTTTTITSTTTTLPTTTTAPPTTTTSTTTTVPPTTTTLPPITTTTIISPPISTTTTAVTTTTTTSSTTTTAPTTTTTRPPTTTTTSSTTTTLPPTTTTTTLPPPTDTTPPMDISDFKAESGDGQLQLSWLTPPDPDFVGVRIRYRTDGTFPVSPQDGNMVGDFTASPLTNGSHLHSGLVNGTTYSYSAFSYDAHGNYSRTVHAQATPQALDNTSADSGNSGPSFGCGRIQDISGQGPIPPGQAVLNLMLYTLIFLAIKIKIKRLLKYRKVLWT